MVVINRSQRTNLPPGGSALPAPSGTRLNIAGQAGRNIAGFGQLLQRIGLQKQAAADKIEIDSATIDLTAQADSIISALATSEQDPQEFEVQANKQLQSLFKKSAKSVGFRNKNEFSLISQNVASLSAKVIRKTKTSKTLDIAKAQRQVIQKSIMGQAATNIAAGVPNAEDVAIKATTDYLVSQFDAGLISANDLTTQIFQTRKDLVQLRVDTLITQGKSKEARQVLANTTFLDPAEKLDMRFKLQGRLNKADVAANKQFKAENEILESEYDELSIKGELPETSDTGLSLESLKVSKLKPKDKRRIVAKNQAIIDKGGIGDELLTNQILSDIADDVLDDPIINNARINSLQDTDSINNKQAIILRNAIKAKAKDLEGRRITPSAKANRASIKRLYRASGITGSSRLKKEALAKLNDTLRLYDAGLDQGLTPNESMANAFKITGNPPRVLIATDTDLIKLQEGQKSLAADIQKITDSKVRQTQNEIDQNNRRVKRYVEDIKDMKEQLRINKEIDDFVNTDATEQRNGQ